MRPSLPALRAPRSAPIKPAPLPAKPANTPLRDPREVPEAAFYVVTARGGTLADEGFIRPERFVVMPVQSRFHASFAVNSERAAFRDALVFVLSRKPPAFPADATWELHHSVEPAAE